MKKLLVEALEAIKNLNLSMIKEKLMKIKGWTEPQSANAVEWYRRYLIVCAKYPEQNHVPTKVIDEVWHLHILDTRKYASDCGAIFGEFKHHTPSYSDISADRLDEDFDRMNQFYRVEFGEDPTTTGDNIGTCYSDELVRAECDDSDGGQSDQN